MKRSGMKGLFLICVTAVGIFLLSQLANYVLWANSLRKKYHNDDVGNVLINDLYIFNMVEHHSPPSVSYLSDWHNGGRAYDSWEEQNGANGTILFRYSYLNPLFGESSSIDILVDAQSRRPWKAVANRKQSHPQWDYRIMTIQRPPRT